MWTWIEVVEPWNRHAPYSPGDFRQWEPLGGGVDGCLPAHRFKTFDSAGDAIVDMGRWLDSEHRESAAYARSAALLPGAPDGEFLLWDMELVRGWMVLRVPEGAHPAAHAQATYRLWQEPAWDRFVHTTSGSGRERGLWSPKGPAASGPGAAPGGCLLLLLPFLRRLS
ncbi:hypothetical protein DN069_14075 [Streptacidiphilus pinicola]|uniref:Uncharacterized protein n=2 Tax=Streptacidiphilus pinicola TaxID=2219663 RepID=A0A2X0IJW9_9ACTN|nr:hypothetical protein DN069_14075 [Streptacidiphilus pinicola]